MVDSLIVGLVLAAISSISYIAYKHPNGYANAYLWLILTVSGIAVSLITYQVLTIVGNSFAIYYMVTTSPNSNLSVIASSAIALYLSLKFIGWTAILATVSILYFGFLKYLPKILELHGKVKHQQEDGEVHKKMKDDNVSE